MSRGFVFFLFVGEVCGEAEKFKYRVRCSKECGCVCEVERGVAWRFFPFSSNNDKFFWLGGKKKRKIKTVSPCFPLWLLATFRYTSNFHRCGAASLPPSVCE